MKKIIINTLRFNEVIKTEEHYLNYIDCFVLDSIKNTIHSRNEINRLMGYNLTYELLIKEVEIEDNYYLVQQMLDEYNNNQCVIKKHKENMKRIEKHMRKWKL